MHARALRAAQAHYEGGAFYLNENFLSSITVTNSSFSSNLAGIYGGAFSVYDSDLLITDSAFTNNSVRAACGAAIERQHRSLDALNRGTQHAPRAAPAKTLHRCRALHCCMAAQLGTTAGRACCRRLCSQASSDGGACQLQSDMASGSGNKLTARRVTFTNNTCGGLGGAAAVNTQGLLLQDVTAVGNRVRCWCQRRACN